MSSTDSGEADPSSESVDSSSSSESAGADNSTVDTATPTQSPSSTESTGGEQISQSSLESLIHEQINEVRTSRGLNELDFDAELNEIARYHSEDMAENEYFSHQSPSGEEMEDRYSKFGYDCRVEVSSNSYLTGGENIHKQSYSGFTPSERELAETVVEDWMDSPGHRENIVKPEWENEAIGVAIVRSGSETTVYVTQNFC
jgi:uncharacterized protein YkwD